MAKRNRSIPELLDNLDGDLGWRIKELSIIKTNIIKTKDKIRQPLIRAGITILYAHWEGFVKNATEYYLQHVSFKKVKHSDLQPCFIALCLRNNFNLIKSNKLKTQAKAIEYLLNELDGKAKVPYKKQVHTGSNLNAERFKDICFLINIDYSKYSLKENFIDKDLLNNRNEIAHGLFLKIKDNEFEEIFSKTIELMNFFKNDIVDCAIKKQYKRI